MPSIPDHQYLNRQEIDDMDTIRGPEGSLHVSDGGTGGMPVLLVHSFGGEISHWDAQLEHLRPTRRAVAMDLRAHGQSEPASNNDYSVQGFSTDIAAVADGVGLERFILIGHSLGGAAAILYAGAHPERVAGLMVVGTPGVSPPEMSEPVIALLDSDKYQQTMDEYMKKLLTNAKPEVASTVDAQFRKIPADRAKAITKAVFAYDPREALKKYNGPSLDLTSDMEPDAPTNLYRLKPGMQHEKMSGTGHWMQMDKPEEFNSIMDKFLASIQR